MRTLRLRYDGSELVVIDEVTYTPRSADNLRRYDHEYDLTDRWRVVSKHGVRLEGTEGSASAMLLAGGGGSTVHPRSALILGDALVVAVGHQLACIGLPRLELRWSRRADSATVFGVWRWNQKIIVHGEFEVSSWRSDGERDWSVSGADIFSEGFALENETAWAKDFEGREYRWQLATGDEVLGPTGLPRLPRLPRNLGGG